MPWVDVAEEVVEKMRHLAVADVALQVLPKPHDRERFLRAAGRSGDLEGAARTMVRIRGELRRLTGAPLAGVAVRLTDGADLFLWRAEFEGPEGTPWEGGRYPLEILFPNDYPASPPTRLRFLSRMWHPNIDPMGVPCVDIVGATLPSPSAPPGFSSPPGAAPPGSTAPPGRRLYRGFSSRLYRDASEGELASAASDSGGDSTGGTARWTPYLGVAAVLLSVQMLFFDTNLDYPVNLEAAAMYRADPAAWRAVAKECARECLHFVA